MVVCINSYKCSIWIIYLFDRQISCFLSFLAWNELLTAFNTGLCSVFLIEVKENEQIGCVILN